MINKNKCTENENDKDAHDDNNDDNNYDNNDKRHIKKEFNGSQTQFVFHLRK